MADQWYYTENRERRGPLSEEQLKELASTGQLKTTDLVWKKGMASWRRASELSWLFPSRSKAEPPPLSPGIAPTTAPKITPSLFLLFTPMRVAIGGIGVAVLGLGILFANSFSGTRNVAPTKVASDGGEGPTVSKQQAGEQQPAIPEVTPAQESSANGTSVVKGNDSSPAHPVTAEAKSQSGTDRETEKARQLLGGCKIVDLKGRHPRGVHKAFLGRKKVETFHSDAQYQWVLVVPIQPSENPKPEKLISVITYMQWFVPEVLANRVIDARFKCKWEFYVICGEGVCHVVPYVDHCSPDFPWTIHLQQGIFVYTDQNYNETRLQKQAEVSFLKGENTE